LRKGSLIIVSGPSGAGKSILVESVLKTCPDLRFSISCTTRQPRANEKDGVHYRFVTREVFESLVAAGEFLEWAMVYDNLYGTSRGIIESQLAAGDDVVLDIDVQGARTVRKECPDALAIFIMPPSYQSLKERLERRRLDRDYVIGQRLRIAGQEIQNYRSYDYLIINESLDRSVEELKSIILALRCRTGYRNEAAAAIVETFGGADAKDL